MKFTLWVRDGSGEGPGGDGRYEHALLEFSARSCGGVGW
jgi:hypothetical protein